MECSYKGVSPNSFSQEIKKIWRFQNYTRNILTNLGSR